MLIYTGPIRKIIKYLAKTFKGKGMVLYFQKLHNFKDSNRRIFKRVMGYIRNKNKLALMSTLLRVTKHTTKTFV